MTVKSGSLHIKRKSLLTFPQSRPSDWHRGGMSRCIKAEQNISNSAGSWMAPRKLKRRDINPTHVCREATDGGRSKSVQQKQAGGEKMVWSPSALAVFCVNFWFCPQTDCTEHSHNISTLLPLFLILCCWEQSAVEWPPHTSFTRRCCCCCFNPDGSTALKHTCSCSFEVKLR